MIKIDKSRDKLFDELGLKRLRESYMRDEETSPQERFAYVSEKFGSNPEHAQRLYDYASRHWLSYSTPILAYGKVKNGLPISCYLSYIHDSKEGLVDALYETNCLSMFGGGVGIGVDIRSADEKSVGIMPHLKVYDAATLAYKQGTRRGSCAAYLNIDHPDIEMFIKMREETGDPRMLTQNLHHGVNITDDFMDIIEKCVSDPNYDDTWVLRDPNGRVRGKTSAKLLWQRLIETRMETGEPYFHFIDTSNRALPKWLKDKDLRITQSNLCSEIMLPTNKERTAVCDLSSLNLIYYPEWKDHPLFISDVLEMLDNTLQVFIDTAPPQIHRAIYSATRERSVGVGALGFHSYLQSKNIAFESLEAININNEMFYHIRKQLDVANRRLGAERGEAPDAVGTGLRLSHVMAIAPNASTSIIMGNISPSIEPLVANAYKQVTTSGSSINKNRQLNKLLMLKCIEDSSLDIDEIWRNIASNNGSVQHLDFLSQHEKNVYKTSDEIDQRWIIIHASNRQRFIDQGQSVNLFFHPTADISYLHDVHFMAWKAGLKALYYCRSENKKKADNLSKQIERVVIEELPDVKNEECLSCEG